MTPARSLAASVVALGFAGALTAPQPALAAPASCEQAENFAAQSGAELLRIDKLELRAPAVDRPRVKPDRTERGTVGDATRRVLSSDDGVIPDPADSDTISEGLGMTATGALGYLGLFPQPEPPPAPKAGGRATPAGRGGLLDRTAERGGAAADDPSDGPAGATSSAGAGGGEPVDGEQSPAPDTEPDRTGEGDDSAGQTGRRTAPGGQATDDDTDSAVEPDSGTGKERTSTASLGEVRLGEARTAMVAEAGIASAAYARMLDGYPGDKGSGAYAAMVKPLLQEAPPTQAKASRRSTPAGEAGPLRLGRGELSTRARWEPGMACGQVVGETGRADTSVTSMSLLKSERGALVRVPGSMTSRGTTALEQDGDVPRTVARSTVTAGRIELAGGRVHLRVLQAPVLEATMSTGSGGKVSYRPAIVEVSGDDIATKRLTVAGDHVDVALTPQYREMESATLRSLTELGGLRKAEPLPVPAVPGLPPVAAPPVESAPAADNGLKLRVALGDVRHAIRDQAIAARVSAIKVSLIESTSSQGRGKNGYETRTGVSLSMSLGVLEAAAVSPGAREITPSGAGGGLPVTGANVTRVALAGGVLLLVGTAAILLTRLRRRS
ncbi:hypothetical protein [Actinoplanes sp. M2I2]|uniref:hypothetical protein n=1 Tax=Actinoplanes sp. M2I2 TaxID=1734444 RepID=UPI002021BA42|nr:hypothetical protein [Actinoplanes sp. M2I2]